jgi:hypothetical protein
MNSLVRIFLLGAALSGLAHAATIYSRGLPSSTNANSGTPATRSNEAWLTGFTDPNNGNYTLAGDDFTFGSNGTINSITVFEVANNNIGDGAAADPASEFASISLYEGPIASPLTFLSSSYTAVQNVYQPGASTFVDQNGFDYAIYALTFGGLSLPVTAGTEYGFALDATANAGACQFSPFGDPCVLALHGSNAGLSGTPQQGSDDQFRYFTLGGVGPVATFENFCDVVCQQGSIPGAAPTDINILISGTLTTPEPATWGTLAAGLAGLLLFARKRG